MDYSVTLSDEQWYEIGVIMGRQLESMKRQRRTDIVSKWIGIYEDMLRRIDDAFPEQE